MERVLRLTRWSVVLVAIASAGVARAAYDFVSVDYPGAQNTQLWDINNSGLAIGTAFNGALTSPIGFLYDTQAKLFTKLPPVPGYDTATFGAINDSGVIVGNAFVAPDPNDPFDQGLAVGVILDHGKYTTFSYPGSKLTYPRAIGNTGLVTGYASFDDQGVLGFIYDSKRGSFIDIVVPSMSVAAIIPQGINGRGDVVGSVYLVDPCRPEDQWGQYGFVRAADGTVTLFRINGAWTRARGITDAGLITGYLTEFGVGENGFAFMLPALGGGFQALTIPETELLSVPFPGATDTLAEGIGNTGHIVGNWLLQHDAGHAFIATPIQNGKQIGVVQPAIRRVPQDFATIQLAIDNANPGDTIQVGTGRWCGAWITKTLNLVGEGATIMGCPPGSSGPVGDLFKLGFAIDGRASGTSIRHFLFDGNGISDTNRDPLAVGVQTLSCTDNLVIDSNTFQGGLIDIVISGDGNRITQNAFDGFTMLSDGAGGAAILELGVPDTGNSILNNQITSKVPPGDFSFISWINGVDVPFAGILVSGEDRTLIANNKISIAANSHGDAGVGVLATDVLTGLTTTDLTITNNDGRGSEYGLIITNDQFGGTGNTVGAVIRGNFGINLINGSTANVTNRSIRALLLCDATGLCP
jgi:hypothetical protein